MTTTRWSSWTAGASLPEAMPEAFPKERPYPGTYVRLRDAAQAHQLIVVKCKDCRRVVRFLAEDLVRILDPDRDVTLPPFPCSKCGSTDRLHVDVTSAGAGDVGLMEVRRPGPIQRTQTWRTMKLGDSYTPDSRPRRPVAVYDLRGRADATMQLIDGYKGWLLELISTMRNENAAIERGLRLALKREDGTAWEDRTAAVLASNEQLLQRMESLIVAMEEEADENRGRIGGRGD
jgi:hypothetical protein